MSFITSKISKLDSVVKRVRVVSLLDALRLPTADTRTVYVYRDDSLAMYRQRWIWYEYVALSFIPISGLST